MKRYIHILVILAVVLSGISPACAFISGKSSTIEICTSKGLKTIALPGAPAQEDDHKKHETKNDCGFCFAQTHLKAAKADAAVFSYAQNFISLKVFPSASARIQRFEPGSLSQRGPPLS